MGRVTGHQTTKIVPKVSYRLTHLAAASIVAALRLLLSLLPADLLPAPCATVGGCLQRAHPTPALLWSPFSPASVQTPALPVPCPVRSVGQPRASCCLSPSPPQSPWPKAPWARLIPWRYLPAQPAWAHSSAWRQLSQWEEGDVRPLFLPVGTHCPNPWVMLHLHPLSIPRTSLEVPTAPPRSPLCVTSSPRGPASHPLEHPGEGHRV